MTTPKLTATFVCGTAIWAGLVGCGRRADFWHGCNLVASADASVFAYAGDDAVVLMRDGKRFSVPGPGAYFVP
jgi:hypothetical protein